jgi:hypothetical protein
MLRICIVKRDAIRAAGSQQRARARENSQHKNKKYQRRENALHPRTSRAARNRLIEHQLRTNEQSALPYGRQRARVNRALTCFVAPPKMR